MYIILSCLYMFTAHTSMKTLAITMLGVFLSVAALSVSMGMMRSMDGMMAPCPFMQDNGAVCSMSLAAHVVNWQQLSTALPTAISIAALVFLYFGLPTLFGAVLRKNPPPLLFEQVRKQNNFRVSPPTPLALAFSQGILHSRLFV